MLHGAGWLIHGEFTVALATRRAAASSCAHCNRKLDLTLACPLCALWAGLNMLTSPCDSSEASRDFQDG